MVEKTGVEAPKVDGGTEKAEESSLENIQEKLNELKRLKTLAETAKEN